MPLHFIADFIPFPSLLLFSPKPPAPPSPVSADIFPISSCCSHLSHSSLTLPSFTYLFFSHLTGMHAVCISCSPVQQVAASTPALPCCAQDRLLGLLAEEPTVHFIPLSIYCYFLIAVYNPTSSSVAVASLRAAKIFWPDTPGAVSSTVFPASSSHYLHSLELTALPVPPKQPRIPLGALGPL